VPCTKGYLGSCTCRAPGSTTLRSAEAREESVVFTRWLVLLAACPSHTERGVDGVHFRSMSRACVVMFAVVASACRLHPGVAPATDSPIVFELFRSECEGVCPKWRVPPTTLRNSALRRAPETTNRTSAVRPMYGTRVRGLFARPRGHMATCLSTPTTLRSSLLSSGHGELMTPRAGRGRSLPRACPSGLLAWRLGGRECGRRHRVDSAPYWRLTAEAE
jgi:hypothetical protein